MPLSGPGFASASPRNQHRPHDEGEEAKAVERVNVERRRYWLAKLPRMYTPGHRQRYLFLNLDNITSALLMSNTLYQHVDGAGSSRDVLPNFAALTSYLSGNNPTTAVKIQLATYCKTNPIVARSLEKFGWTLKLVASGDNALYNELTGQLDKGAVNTNGKTLVLRQGAAALAQPTQMPTVKLSLSS
ncbi:hypothetical protein V7S43_011037 [Phytophthora oleae]|uniref:Uncharacterized protein n=1 Tax=Phytophthora oleae TaxID=2107226 RepID=A0ABD3FCY5_9STRA